MNPLPSLADLESARYEETYAGESQHHLQVPAEDVLPSLQHLSHLPHLPHHDEEDEDEATYDDDVTCDDDEEDDPTYEEPVVPDDDMDSQEESLEEDEDREDLSLSSDGLSSEAKYQAVVQALQEGKSYSTISKETGVPKSTVGSIKRRWMTKGNLSDGRKHNGRPPKLNSRQLKMIENVLENSHGTLSSTELLKMLKFDVSARTIRRAKRAIMEKRSEERRNSVIAAARSLAVAAAAAAAAAHNVPSIQSIGASSPLRSQKLLRSHRKRSLGKKEPGGILV